MPQELTGLTAGTNLIRLHLSDLSGRSGLIHHLLRSVLIKSTIDSNLRPGKPALRRLATSQPKGQTERKGDRSHNGCKQHIDEGWGNL